MALAISRLFDDNVHWILTTIVNSLQNAVGSSELRTFSRHSRQRIFYMHFEQSTI